MRNRKPYSEMTEEQKNGYRNSVKRVVEKKMAVVNAYKKERGCCVCREDDPIVLDFHHRDESSKSPVLKRQKGNRSVWVLGWSAMFEEMEKCDVMCSNCHRRYEHTKRAMERSV
jgi:uncharacterized protein (DUF1015 family)